MFRNVTITQTKQNNIQNGESCGDKINNNIHTTCLLALAKVGYLATQTFASHFIIRSKSKYQRVIFFFISARAWDELWIKNDV